MRGDYLLIAVVELVAAGMLFASGGLYAVAWFFVAVAALSLTCGVVLKRGVT